MSDDIYSMTKVGFHNALREAKAQALEEAADECAKTSSNIVNNNPNLSAAWDGMAEGWKNAGIRLRARAAKMRQP